MRNFDAQRRMVGMYRDEGADAISKAVGLVAGLSLRFLYYLLCLYIVHWLGFAPWN